jgi:hypothetical protein
MDALQAPGTVADIKRAAVTPAAKAGKANKLRMYQVWLAMSPVERQLPVIQGMRCKHPVHSQKHSELQSPVRLKANETNSDAPLVALSKGPLRIHSNDQAANA